MATETLDPSVAAPAARILVVDDERSMREMLGILLRREGHDVVLADNGRRAIECLNQKPFDLVVSDARMPDIDGLEVLRHARSINPSVIAIMITAFGSPDLIKGVEQLGVTDYVEKPFNTEVLKFRIRKELDRRRLQQENVLLKRAMHSAHQFSNIIGNSSAMLQVFEMVETVAPTGSTVLVTGESGTGKELIARAIHVRSSRQRSARSSPSTAAPSPRRCSSRSSSATCAARSPARREQEGPDRSGGQAARSSSTRSARCARCCRSSCCACCRNANSAASAGPKRSRPTSAIIAATNRDLGKMVAEGQLPRGPLSTASTSFRSGCRRCASGREDVPLLAEHFVAKFATQMKKNVTSISGAALNKLTAHAWPGNVRELENAMERAVALERTPSILPESLPESVQAASSLGPRVATATAAAPAAASNALPDQGFDLEQHVQHLEREYIAEALRRSGGVKVKAAELLGMSFRSFRYYMKKYNLK